MVAPLRATRTLPASPTAGLANLGGVVCSRRDGDVYSRIDSRGTN